MLFSLLIVSSTRNKKNGGSSSDGQVCTIFILPTATPRRTLPIVCHPHSRWLHHWRCFSVDNTQQCHAKFNSFSWVNKFHVLFWHQSNCFRSFRPGQGKEDFFLRQRLVTTVILVCYSGCLLQVKDFRPARVSLENWHIPSHEQRDYLAEFVSALNAMQKKGHWFKWQLIN